MDEYYELKFQDLDTSTKKVISVETSSIVISALQFSWVALIAAFISFVTLVICIMFVSTKYKKTEVNQVN